MQSLTLDWLHVVYLLGAVQGLFLTGALVAKRSNRTANRLLAALMFTFSIFLASAVYHGMGWERRYPHFFGAAYPMPLLFGPLVYLYALAAADRSYRLTRRDLLHFVPFLALILVALPIYLMSGAEKIAFYEGLKRGEVPTLLAVADPIKMLSGVTYATLTMVFLLRHRERVKDSYSSTEKVNLEWLLWLGSAAAAVWAMAISVDLLKFVGAPPGAGDALVSLAIAVLVYGIGYKGLKQPEVFRYETAEFPIPATDVQPETPRLVLATATANAGRTSEEEEEEQEEPIAPRYEKSGLSERQAERLRVALVNVMDNERPWQNSELTLADLATRLKTTPHKLSEVLNAQLGQTFYDFVNGYRVREVQRRIAAGEAQRVKMLTIALDAGFASKSTFNVVFKKVTSKTPSDYRQASGA